MILIPTILCGGVGSRLWPVSRELHPKPFIHLANGMSLLQNAYTTAANITGVSEILTVTNQELFFKISDEYQAVNPNKIHNSFILEPFGKNTAPAIAAACLFVQKKYGDDAILLILAADHLISDQNAFQKAVKSAIQFAQDGNLVTFGIHATSPETGFGYIKADKNTVVEFVEKPTLSKAEEYIKAQNYFWNSGMFCFTAGKLRQELNQHCPEIIQTVSECMESSKEFLLPSITQIELNLKTFKEIPENSIDYALMEKSNKVSVVPCDIGWSDLGTWNTMVDLVKADDKGNRLTGDVLVHDVKNSYIQSTHRCIGAVGIENLMIIDTPDALLVADRSRAQDVGKIYTKLKDNNHEAHKLHRTVFRPWGTYTVIEQGIGFKIKRIVVNPSASLSLQMHRHRSEHWVVVSGIATVTNGEQLLTIKTNESTYIPPNVKHRLQNLTNTPVTIIEVQSGNYLGEDDIIRFEDIYGRAKDDVSVE